LRFIFSIGLLLVIQVVTAQTKLSKKGGFLFPIKPGKPNSLTGNMGELRSNHFHGGIDIRTGWASGLPVFCAKDGWVSRVIMAGEGYGNVLFVTHPDGFVTLYAHLEKLAAPLADYVKRQQYQQKKFEVDLLLRKDIFKVRQGDTIAISGNTGSSRGPHLHFEIRDTTNLVYNPLAFGFEEITDNLAPVFDRLALVPLDINARINGKFERKEIPVKLVGNSFVAMETPAVSGTVGLELLGRDRITNGTQHGGIFCIELQLGGKLVYYHNLNTFPFEKSNHINQLINYKNYRITGEKFQKLYSPDGYFQSPYMLENQKGRIEVGAGEVLEAEICLYDVKGNKRKCTLKLKGEKETPVDPVLRTRASRATYDVVDNTLIIKTNGLADSLAVLYQKGKKSVVFPAYSDGGKVVYLQDLRKSLPDSFAAGNGASVRFSFKAMVTPKVGCNISVEGAGITIPENALFDTLFLEVAQEGANYRINSSAIPLHRPITISTPCSACSTPDGSRWRGYAEASTDQFSKSLFSECREDNIFFKSKYLGRFKSQKDSIPPVIRVGVCNSSWARFNLYDNLSGIDSVEATINGNWLLMVADKKQHLWYADPLPAQLPMQGEFRLRVTDKAGNVKEFIKKI